MNQTTMERETIGKLGSRLLGGGLVYSLVASSGIGVAVAQSTGCEHTLEVVSRAQARYSELSSFQSDFVQVFKSRLDSTEQIFRGVIRWESPASLEIRYTSGQGGVVTTDGASVVWRYTPTLTLSQGLPPEFGAFVDTMLRSDLSEYFAIRCLDDGEHRLDGTVLELRPLAQLAYFERVLVLLEHSETGDGLIRRLLFIDWAGNTTRFEFLEIQAPIRRRGIPMLGPDEPRVAL